KHAELGKTQRVMSGHRTLLSVRMPAARYGDRIVAAARKSKYRLALRLIASRYRRRAMPRGYRTDRASAFPTRRDRASDRAAPERSLPPPQSAALPLVGGLHENRIGLQLRSRS